MVRGNGGLSSPHSGGQQEAADGTSQCYGAGTQETDAIARHGTRAGSRGKRDQECDAGGCADLGSGVEYARSDAAVGRVGGIRRTGVEMLDVSVEVG